MGAAVVLIALRAGGRIAPCGGMQRNFCWALPLVPVLWLAYNAAVYGNALAFANGPYSAKAIEQRVGAPNPARPQCRGRGHLFPEIGAVEYGEWELGPILAGRRPCWRWQSEHGNCGRNRLPLAVAVGSAGCSTRFRSPTARCRFMSTPGGHLPLSTSATDSSCCRCSRFRPEC